MKERQIRPGPEEFAKTLENLDRLAAQPNFSIHADEATFDRVFVTLLRNGVHAHIPLREFLYQFYGWGRLDARNAYEGLPYDEPTPDSTLAGIPLAELRERYDA